MKQAKKALGYDFSRTEQNGWMVLGDHAPRSIAHHGWCLRCGMPAFEPEQMRIHDAWHERNGA